MGSRKLLAAPTAQMTVTLASFPVSDTDESFLNFRPLPQLRAH